MGCFYIWGAQARRWEKMRCSLNAYERILDAIETTTKTIHLPGEPFQHPSITTTLPHIGLFSVGNCFTEGTAAKLLSPGAGQPGVVLKGCFL